ncbi:MAG: hypothetical protein AAF108_00985 [Planctomycetota bacterium]
MPHPLNAWAVVLLLVCRPCVGQIAWLDMTANDVIRLSQDTGKPVLMYFRVPWARGVSRLERDTLRDADVCRLVNTSTLPLRVDADADPEAAAAARIRSYPILVLFDQQGQIVSEPLSGYRDARDVYNWIANAVGVDGLEGPSSRRVLLRRLPATIESALSLVDQEQDEDAAELLAWMWSNMDLREPALAALRRTLVARSIREVSRRHEPTREVFLSLREDSAALLTTGTGEWGDLRDWLTLCRITDDNDAALAWTRSRLGNDGGRAIVRRLSTELTPILLETRELDLLDRVSPDGLAWVQRAFASIGVLEPGSLRTLQDRLAAERLRAASEMYASLLARQRDADADALARWVVVELGSPGVVRDALLAAALDWKEARSLHTGWLPVLPEPRREELTERLEALLTERGSSQN